MNPIKCLKLISTLKEQIKNNTITDEATYIRRSVVVIDELAAEVAEEKNRLSKTGNSIKGIQYCN